MASRPWLYALSAPTGACKPMQPRREIYGGFKFKDRGFEFYKHPPAHAANINKFLYNARLSPTLVHRILTDLDKVAKDYRLSSEERKVAETLPDLGTFAGKASDFVPRLTDLAVHPLMALMGIHAIYPVAKKLAQEGVGLHERIKTGTQKHKRHKNSNSCAFFYRRVTK